MKPKFCPSCGAPHSGTIAYRGVGNEPDGYECGSCKARFTVDEPVPPATTSTAKKPYRSASQYNTFGGCAERFRRRYILGEKIPPGFAQLRGTGVHGGARVNHQQKLTSHVDLAVSKIVEAADAEFEAVLKKDGYTLNPDEESRGLAAVRGDAKDSMVRLTSLYGREVAPRIQPAMVEERIEIEIPGSPVNLLGILDVATTDGRVVDLKTAAKAKPASEADNSLQLTTYAAVYAAKTGALPKSLDLEVLVDTKVPKVQTLTTNRTPADFTAFTNRVNAIEASIQAGNFPPVEPGHWSCNPKWCGFYSTCRFVNSERKAAAEAWS